MKASHFQGACFSPHSLNITQSWVHLASGFQFFGGGKRTFFWSALLLYVTTMVFALLPNDPGRLYRPPRPSEDGDLCDL